MEHSVLLYYATLLEYTYFVDKVYGSCHKIKRGRTTAAQYQAYQQLNICTGCGNNQQVTNSVRRVRQTKQSALFGCRLTSISCSALL